MELKASKSTRFNLILLFVNSLPRLTSDESSGSSGLHENQTKCSDCPPEQKVL